MSAMLEAFDTQMADFQADSDYIMQLSSSDPWSQEEATMEADGHTPLQTTIEVDMEPYDEEHHQPEYEMEDDLGTLGAALNDVRDVEVYDASRFQSPDIPHDESPIANPTQPLATAAEDNESSTHIISMPKTQNLDDSTFQEPCSPAPRQSEVSISTTGEPTTVTLLETENHIEGCGLTVTKDDYDSSNVAAEEPRTTLELEVENPGEGAEEGLETLHVHPDTELSGDDVNQHVESTVSAEFEDSTSDPHEISEGVYIDPPPPVLISLYAGEPTISLFNIPSKASLDSRLQDESDIDLVLLLGQLPTLYYEPLSSVFEAFRQEEYLSGIPGLLNGELLLDAYDLELTMYEDNTYAHEFSLHDLNVLHDGLNKHGPLCLRLKTGTTRFIDRYHSLQSQITQSQATEPTTQREIPSIDSSTEEHPDASHVARVETSGKEILSEGPVAGVNPAIQAEAPGVDFVSESDATDTESYQQEVDKGPVVPENHEHQQDDHETEQKTEPSEDHYYPEDYVAVESTISVVETNNAEPTNNRDIPEFESEANKNTPSREYDLKNFDGLHRHADDPHELNESERASAEVASTDLTDVRYSDHGVNSQILQHAIVPVRTQEKDIGDIDDFHLDDDERHGVDEESDPSNSVQKAVEFDLPIETEGEQANSSVNTGFEATEDILDVHDDTWDDSLDGEGDWEADDDEKESEYRNEQSFEHEHGHEHDTVSNSSSVTLSSKASFKRSLSEAELEDIEDEFSTGSPDSKKPRVEYETSF